MSKTKNFPNRSLCQGENLDFLRAMKSESIDLIATDPPFNSGRDYFADPNSIAKGAYFPDKWAWSVEMRDQHLKELKEINPKAHYYVECVWQTLGDGALTSFLLFMSLRLVEMHRVLKPTGSIYLHCDHHASHYLKQLMDVLFGVDNFRNEIIWQYDGPQRPSLRNFGSKHDVILRYSKTKKYFSNEDGIAPFRLLNHEEIKSYKKLDDGRYYYTTPKGDYTDISIERLKTEDRIEYTKNDRVRVRHFLPTDSGGNVGRKKQIPDVWNDIVSLGHAGGKERVGYPTQKPVTLYERIVKASSNEEDVVLDPFCGCATTLVAAENLGRQWIGIDIHPQTRTITANRIAKACNLNSPDGSVLAESTLLNLEKDLDIHIFTKEDLP